MPYPGGEKQLRAIFLSIRRKKGEKAARDWRRKVSAEGYGGKKKRLRDHMVEQRKRGGRRSSRA